MRRDVLPFRQLASLCVCPVRSLTSESLSWSFIFFGMQVRLQNV